jgi:putative intracellular protease/amidase
VCHGPAIFAGIKDEAGVPIVKGRKITGFTTQAEHDMKIMEALRSWGEPLVDEHAEALGAECKFWVDEELGGEMMLTVCRCEGGGGVG